MSVSGESVCLHGDSVFLVNQCPYGESVCLHGESVCLYVEKMYLHGESVCVWCVTVSAWRVSMPDESVSAG